MENNTLIPQVKLSKREKKRKARKALLLFLQRMRKSCSAYGTAQEWYDEMKKLKGVLEEYTDILPKEKLAKVNATMGISDLTGKGISRACKTLRYDLKKLAKKLPMLGSASAFLVKGLVAAAIIGGGASVYWNASKVKLTIVNNGCSDIPLASDLPQDVAKMVKIAGIKLPLWIATNGQESFSIPPLTVTVEGSGNALTLSSLGQSARLTVPENVTSITIDGQEVLHTAKTVIDFRAAQEHTAVATCG